MALSELEVTSAGEPTPLGGEDLPPGLSPYRLAWRRLRRNRTALFFGGLFILLVVLCLLAPVYSHDIAHLGPDDEAGLSGSVMVNGHSEEIVSAIGIPIGPTWHSKYFLGADALGRDVAVRLLYGGRNSLEIGAVATLITMILATILGTIAGYFRGLADGIISRVMDVLWAYPAVLLGVVLGVTLAVGGIDLGIINIKGNDLLIPAVVIGIVYIPYVAKPIRGQVLSLREREFIDAARQQGLGPWRIMMSEIRPNLASTFIVFLPLILANAILLEAALSFLGAGVQPPNPSWGTMISDGVDTIPAAFHLVLVPGIMLVLTVLSVNVFGDGLRDALDPRAKIRVALMLRFVVRRLASMVVVLFAISVLTFLLFAALPNGNPALRLAGRTATQSEIHQIEVKYGFNKPIWVQYVRTMKNIFTGQAYSYSEGYNVNSAILRGLPATLSLAFGAGFIWLFISILVGTLAAIKSGRFLDRVLTVLSMTGVSFPPFFLGAVLIYFLGYKANIFPLDGYVPLTQNPLSWLTHLILPWFTLSVLFIGFYSRVLRSTILDTINEDYVRTARAKGLSERQVMVRHVLRNSLIPIISLWGLDIAQVIGGGAILTETIYNLNGVGELARNAIGLLDIVTIMVITMFTAFAVVLLASVIDILYAALDPRIRLTA